MDMLGAYRDGYTCWRAGSLAESQTADYLYLGMKEYAERIGYETMLEVR